MTLPLTCHVGHVTPLAQVMHPTQSHMWTGTAENNLNYECALYLCNAPLMFFLKSLFTLISCQQENKTLLNHVENVHFYLCPLYVTTWLSKSHRLKTKLASQAVIFPLYITNWLTESHSLKTKPARQQSFQEVQRCLQITDSW